MSKSGRDAVISSIVFAATVLAGSTYALPAKPKVRLTMGKRLRRLRSPKKQETSKVRSLRKEKGRWIYSFDIKRNGQIHEVGVDANTGEIVEDSVESPADEAKEEAKH